ncbi:hypothetical protein AcV5_008160 [Taiwanofungus camphoratus]|nr:hypothetical protein AcV5_008160 [Antrodia cinnamomea]
MEGKTTTQVLSQTRRDSHEGNRFFTPFQCHYVDPTWEFLRLRVVVFIIFHLERIPTIFHALAQCSGREGFVTEPPLQLSQLIVFQYTAETFYQFHDPARNVNAAVPRF